mgnify:CR=1 FL=1
MSTCVSGDCCINQLKVVHQAAQHVVITPEQPASSKVVVQLKSGDRCVTCGRLSYHRAGYMKEYMRVRRGRVGITPN